MCALITNIEGLGTEFSLAIHIFFVGKHWQLHKKKVLAYDFLQLQPLIRFGSLVNVSERQLL